MRKAVSTTVGTRRPTKEQRKEDEDIQQTQDTGSAGLQSDNQQKSQSEYHELLNAINTRQTREKEEQTHPPNNAPPSSGNKTSNSAAVQEHRKVVTDEAALQAKNYRLAKELSEIRVRHREECKHVTRLTMENMNLASRCRETMSHVAIIKKELSLQKKKTAEAISLQQKLSEQIAEFLRKESSSSIVTAPAKVESSVENEKLTGINGGKNDDNNENANPRLRIVSEEFPAAENSPVPTDDVFLVAPVNPSFGSTITTILPTSNNPEPTNNSPGTINIVKGKKSDAINRSPKAPPVVGVTDVAAELDRMDQILAEHVESTSSHRRSSSEPTNSSSTHTRKLSKESRKHLSIVEAVIQNQHILSQTGIESQASVSPVELDESEHKCDDYMELLTMTFPGMEKVTVGIAPPELLDHPYYSDPAKSPEDKLDVHLISSDDYEEDTMGLSDNEIETQSHPTFTEETSKSLPTTDGGRLDDDLMTNRTETTSKHKDSPQSARKYFPYTASPKIDFTVRGASLKNNYNEEFPEDISPSVRKASLERKLRKLNRDDVPQDENEPISAPSFSSSSISSKQNKLSFRNGRSTSQSSIDAFEASFHAQFPESFAVREASIAEESEGEGGPTRKSDYSDIYDPFSTSPVRLSSHNSSEIIKDSHHEGFLKESSLPLLLPQRTLDGISDISNDTNDRKPLLAFKPRKDDTFGYQHQGSKSPVSKETDQNLNRRRQIRKPAFFDPPGKDRTSPRAQQPPDKGFQPELRHNVRRSNAGTSSHGINPQSVPGPNSFKPIQQSFNIPPDVANTKPLKQGIVDFLDDKIRTAPVRQTASSKGRTVVNRDIISSKVSTEKDANSQHVNMLASRQTTAINGNPYSPTSSRINGSMFAAPSSPMRRRVQAAAGKQFKESVAVDIVSTDSTRTKEDRDLNKQEKESNRSGAWPKSNKFVNTISSYFSAAAPTRTTEEDGDIPMFSKLSPEKAELEDVDESHRRRLSNDIVPTNLTALRSWQDCATDPTVVEETILPFQDCKGDPASDSDDIVEVYSNKPTLDMSDVGEFAASARFTLHATTGSKQHNISNALHNSVTGNKSPRPEITGQLPVVSKSTSPNSSHSNQRSWGSRNGSDEQKEARVYMDI